MAGVASELKGGMLCPVELVDLEDSISMESDTDSTLSYYRVDLISRDHIKRMK